MNIKIRGHTYRTQRSKTGRYRWQDIKTGSVGDYHPFNLIVSHMDVFCRAYPTAPLPYRLLSEKTDETLT